jgi:hypothetical protein
MQLNEFLHVVEKSSYEGRSDLWCRLSGSLNAHIPKDVSDGSLLQAIDQLGKELHYGFYYTESANDLKQKINLAAAAKKNAIGNLKQLRSVVECDIEDLAAYVFLDQIELFDEYLELARVLSFSPNMSSARHFYYASRICALLKAVGRSTVRVMEIGAGAGNLAILLHHYGLVEDYTINDLPEMLLMSGVNLQMRAGQICRFNEFPASCPSGGANYCIGANERLSAIPDGIFDLVLNFNSFSEMPPSVVNTYFHTIYRTAKTGALFMNVNRIQDHHQSDGRVFKMNPLLFPYHSNDRILTWDVDPFQQFVRQFHRTKAVKSTAIMRIATVRES